MCDTDENFGLKRWVRCYWTEKFESVETPRQGGVVAPGILMIPPPVLELVGGLWAELNEEFDILLDMAEEDEIQPDQLPKAASIVSQFVERIRSRPVTVHHRKLGVQYGPGSETRDVIAEMSAHELAKHLEILADFLTDAAAQGKEVTIAL